jgi:hypothetical protein
MNFLSKGQVMTITLKPDLEAALKEHARQQGVSPETLVVNLLQEKLAPSAPPFQPWDEWERLVLSNGTDCKVSLPDSALSSEGLYE